MAIRTADIAERYWSPRVGSPGEIVTGLDDLDQCICIILKTRKGSVPHRPLFGCDAWLYLDRPVNVAIPNIVREVADALEMWEPRIELVKVTATVDGSQATVTITWQPRGTDTVITTEVTIGNPA